MTATPYTVRIGDKTWQVPQSWNDLPLQHQLEVYNILTAGAGRILHAAEVLPTKRIAIVARLLGLTDEFFTQWLTDCRAAHGKEDGDLVYFNELNELLKVTDFLFDIEEDEEGNKTYQVKLSLTDCPWPKIIRKEMKRKKIYYAPANSLSNFTLHELAIAFTTFERYLETNNMADADQLLATIYRPGKARTAANRQSGYEGDRRLPLFRHESRIPIRQKLFHRLAEPVKKLLLFWFACCRHQIISSYPNIFKRESAMQIEGERVGNDYGWGGLLLSLSGGIVNLDQVSQQPYENGLVYLSYLEDQRKEAEMRRTFL